MKSELAIKRFILKKIRRGGSTGDSACDAGEISAYYEVLDFINKQPLGKKQS